MHFKYNGQTKSTVQTIIFPSKRYIMKDANNTIANGYNKHDISRLAKQTNLSVEDYVEINEQNKHQDIVEKYQLFSEIREAVNALKLGKGNS